MSDNTPIQFIKDEQLEELMRDFINEGVVEFVDFSDYDYSRRGKDGV